MFGGLDVGPRLRDRIHTFSIESPDNPTPEQVDAWIELAELVRDPGFRARLRTWMELNTPVLGQGRPSGASIWWARKIVQTVAEVRKRGVASEGPEAAEVLSELAVAVSFCVGEGMDGVMEAVAALQQSRRSSGHPGRLRMCSAATGGAACTSWPLRPGTDSRVRTSGRRPRSCRRRHWAGPREERRARGVKGGGRGRFPLSRYGHPHRALRTGPAQGRGV